MDIGKMDRRLVLSCFGLTAAKLLAAQTKKKMEQQRGPHSDGIDYAGPAGTLGSPGLDDYTFHKVKPPKNHECPVCGEMAAPFEIESLKIAKDCEPIGKLGSADVVCKMDKIFAEEPARLTRCKTCNAAFYHDADNLGKR